MYRFRFFKFFFITPPCFSICLPLACCLQTDSHLVTNHNYIVTTQTHAVHLHQITLAFPLSQHKTSPPWWGHYPISLRYFFCPVYTFSPAQYLILKINSNNDDDNDHDGNRAICPLLPSAHICSRINNLNITLSYKNCSHKKRRETRMSANSKQIKKKQKKKGNTF